MKRIAAFVLLIATFVSLFACGEKRLLEDALQMGTTTGQSDTKGTEKGSLSNPYSINETITITSYESEGYNYATKKRTVINPATWEITVGDMLVITDREYHYEDANWNDVTDNLAVFAPVSVKILSTSGDRINWSMDCLAVNDICLVTKNRREVAHGGVDFVYKYLGEQTKYSAAGDGLSYEGSSSEFLVGDLSTILGIESADDLELLRFSYFDETGESRDVYIALH